MEFFGGVRGFLLRIQVAGICADYIDALLKLGIREVPLWGVL